MKTRVKSGDVDLAVTEHGDRAHPTVVLVHGYPDTQEIWKDTVPLLTDRFHVVTYDLRGMGESTAPADRAGYDLDRLREDFLAVIQSVVPDKRVHYVGHDWGSILGWHVAIDPEAAQRLLSFTSMSGPCLDQVGHWLRFARKTKVARQSIRSWYIGAFQVPGVPRLLPGRLQRGAELYRRNIPPRLVRPRPDPIARVPVQLLVLTRDPYVSTDIFDGIERWVPLLRRHEVVSGHWVQREHPKVVARLVTEFIEAMTREGSSGGAFARTNATTVGGPFSGKVVFITGAGSGIGRASALAFAERGARVLAVDIDRESVTKTVELVRAKGGDAHPFLADVSDARAMEALADDVCAHHGVPDVVVNNAGIGIAGPFLETTSDEFRRLLDVNLGGVAHGCRIFGRRMVERRQPGHIVNVASAAAFLPSRALPVYATSKAAVLMLSECLRAELAEHGIGVTAICPGVVATNITKTTRFAGMSTDDEKKRRDAADRLYAKRDFSPELVAEEIVDAVLRDRAVVPVTIEAKVLRLLGRFAPEALRVRLAGLDALPR